MPNHITNKVTFIGPQKRVEEVLEKIKNRKGEEGEYTCIDFNNILPMPEELRGTCSPPRRISEDEYKKEVAKFSKDPENQIFRPGITKKMYDDYMKRFGAADWYKWACNNWGTKWNAYDQSYEGMNETNSGCVEATIIFDTAWSTPIPVIEKLSEMFPDIHIELKWADEDWGNNCGRAMFCDGTAEISMPVACSKEAYDLVFELKPGSKEYFKLENGEYVYIEEE